MAGKTISQLPLATTPLAGTESVPIVRSGVTYKTTVADVAKSPQDGATSYGVVYYDGNKMPASGSAFTFDGTNVAATGTVSVAKLIPTGSSVAGTGIYSPSSNAIAWSNNGVQTMQLDASGNLGLGVTPSAWLASSKAFQFGATGSLFNYSAANRLSENVFFNASGTAIYLANGYAELYLQNGGAHTWYTAPSGTAGNAITLTQAMTLNAAGVLSVTSTATNDTFNAYQKTTTATDVIANFLSDITTAGTTKCRVMASGNLQNVNNSYGALSDAKLKENVTDATPKLEKLQQVRVVNYNLIGETQKQIGVIAQELEQIFPGMIEESPDRDKEGNNLGTTTKSVKYSVFVPMLIKAIQEQQAILEQLTARVVALEAKQAA